jgi:hypothetical protein
MSEIVSLNRFVIVQSTGLAKGFTDSRKTQKKLAEMRGQF